MKRLSIFITCVVFVAYFSLLLGGAHETVLCLGENGHIAIEASQKGNCKKFLSGFYLADPSSLKPVISGSTEQHCGPCLDFDLSAMYSSRMAAPVPKNSFPLPLKNAFSGTGYTLFSKTHHEILPSPVQFSEHPRTTLLQTTVLLI